MIDYEKLENELNDYAKYLLASIKRYYNAFLDSKQAQINKLLNLDKLVVIDSIVDTEKIHINPNHKIFMSLSYKEIATYIENNMLLTELLKLIITLSISEKSFAIMENPNENQSCCIFLRRGFISYIALEFTESNRLPKPDINSTVSLEFINMLKKQYLDTSIIRYAFYNDYTYFCEKFYEQTGEDILDLYRFSSIDLLEEDSLNRV